MARLTETEGLTDVQQGILRAVRSTGSPRLAEAASRRRFMIMGQRWPYLAKTTHDHGLRPKCVSRDPGGKAPEEGQRTLLIFHTPIEATMATAAVAPNRAG